MRIHVFRTVVGSERRAKRSFRQGGECRGVLRQSRADQVHRFVSQRQRAKGRTRRVDRHPCTLPVKAHQLKPFPQPAFALDSSFQGSGKGGFAGVQVDGLAGARKGGVEQLA